MPVTIPETHTIDEINEKMTKALMIWAKRKNLRPVDFQKSMGWSYSYAYTVIKGINKFKAASWGPFIQAYGMNALDDIFVIADIDPNEVL